MFNLVFHSMLVKCTTNCKFKLLMLYWSTVIQGIPNHWEFRVSGRNLLKIIK